MVLPPLNKNITISLHYQIASRHTTNIPACVLGLGSLKRITSRLHRKRWDVIAMSDVWVVARN